MSYIVTHQNPDFDAIASVWLLKKFEVFIFLCPDKTDIKFVNTGNPDKEILAGALAVVDTGKVFDPGILRFDHHHLPGQAANDTCATKQVHEYLISQDVKIEYLSPLIELIFQGDTGRPEAKLSRELGIHALLSAFKASYKERGEVAKDQEIMEYGFSLLDLLELRLRNQVKIKEELASKVVYKSEDNLLWAIKYGSQGSSFAAFEEGARIVIFEGEPVELEGGTTYPIGIQRNSEWDSPNVGELVAIVKKECLYGSYFSDKCRSVYLELGSWFNHPGGFFSGRGTPKAPVFKGVEIDISDLARRIDRAWIR